MSTPDDQAAGQPVEPDPNAPDAPVGAANDDPSDDAETRGEDDVEASPEPDHDPADTHTGPLDDDEDARHLDPSDVRRQDAERRRGKPFDDDEPEAEQQQDQGQGQQTPDDS